LSVIGLIFGVAELAVDLAVQEMRTSEWFDKLARDMNESLSELACVPICNEGDVKSGR
jgi:hypothetical protein